MAKADFLTGLIVFVLGIYMILEGLRLPGAGGFIEAGGEPGRVPVMLGAILSMLALVLIGRSIAHGGHRLRTRSGVRALDLTGWLRSALTAVGCSIYAVGLLGAEILGWSVQYRGATVLFVFLFIAGFEWAEAPAVGRRRWAWLQGRSPATAQALSHRLGFVPGSWGPYVWLILTAVVQALIVAFVIGYLFESELYVKLP